VYNREIKKKKINYEENNEISEKYHDKSDIELFLSIFNSEVFFNNFEHMKRK